MKPKTPRTLKRKLAAAAKNPLFLAPLKVRSEQSVHGKDGFPEREFLGAFYDFLIGLSGGTPVKAHRDEFVRAWLDSKHQPLRDELWAARWGFSRGRSASAQDAVRTKAFKEALKRFDDESDWDYIKFRKWLESQSKGGGKK